MSIRTTLIILIIIAPICAWVGVKLCHPSAVWLYSDMLGLIDATHCREFSS